LHGVAAQDAYQTGAEAGTAAVAAGLAGELVPLRGVSELRDVLLREHAVHVVCHGLASEWDVVTDPSLGCEGDLHIGTTT
jgi:hypothetical protein